MPVHVVPALEDVLEPRQVARHRAKVDASGHDLGSVPRLAESVEWSRALPVRHRGGDLAPHPDRNGPAGVGGHRFEPGDRLLVQRGCRRVDVAGLEASECDGGLRRRVTRMRRDVPRPGVDDLSQSTLLPPDREARDPR